MSRAEFFRSNSSSDLGWIWNILKPLLYIGMFYVAINLGFRSSKDIDGIVCPYLIWLATGIYAWFYLQTAIFGGAGCFKKHKSLIYKLNYPVTVIPMIPVLSGLLTHVIMVGILFVMAVLSGVKPDIHWIQIPFYTCLAILFGYVWSLLSGLLTVLTADFQNLIKSIRPAFFWLSGIFFNSRARQGHQEMFLYNPITYIVEGYRNCVCYNMWFWENMRGLGAFLTVLLILLVASLILYRRMKKHLPDII